MLFYVNNIKTSDEVLQLIEAVEDFGLDAMSTGVVLGWATEAYMNNLITIDQTQVPLSFGNTENYLKIIESIAYKKSDFFIALAEGVDKASDIYGGKDYAMAFSKNEMAGYHTGYGMILGSVVGARHSHLCNGGYSIDQSMKEFNKEKLVEAIFSEEKERCMLNSLIICLFARKVYDIKTILSALNSIGNSYSDEDLTAISERIYKTKLRIKKALGFDQSNVKLPKRLFQTPSLSGKLDENTAYELIDMYNEKIKAFMKQEISS